MSNLQRYYLKKCSSILNGGCLVDDGDDFPIPDEIKLIIDRYNESESIEQKKECCQLLSQKLHARFVWDNIPALESIILCDEASIEATETEIFHIESDGEYWPSVKAIAYFEIKFIKDFNYDDLLNWEQENDYLTDCVCFYWRIDENTELHIEDDMGFELIE